MAGTAKKVGKPRAKKGAEQFQIRNRFTGEVLFTAELTCSPDALSSFKLGLAVKAAVGARANLAGANLAYANLARADLAGANLAHANLARADLAYANLAYANLADANFAYANLAGAKGLSDETLRPIKADFFLTLLHAKAEVPTLVAALREGRVDGSQYQGECACLVGTLANAMGEPYRAAFPDVSADHPAERWFTMIRRGDKAGDDSGGGFAADKALEWATEFCALEGIELAEQVPA